MNTLHNNKPSPILLQELNYHWDNKDGRQLFWDFYAMYYLWAEAGGGTNIFYKGANRIGTVVTNALSQDVIDHLFSQVLRKSTDALIYYLKRACLLELQHFTSKSKIAMLVNELALSGVTADWSRFKPVCKQIFPTANPEILYKTIAFMYYYDGSYSTFYLKLKDAHDKNEAEVQDIMSKPDDYSEPKHDIPASPDAEKSDSETETEPDSEEDDKYVTDYEAPDIPDYVGNKDNKWVQDPDNPRYSMLKEIGTGDYHGNEKVDSKIGLKTIRRVSQALKKAGLSLSDVAELYRHDIWGENSAYGGDAWGDGMEHAMDLEKFARVNFWDNKTMEKIAFQIDKIYDLNHNTGNLLNKGRMHVSDTDLNRRAKMTDIARMVPYVSQPVRQQLIRYLPVVGSKAAEVSLEADIYADVIPLTDKDFSILTKKYPFAKDGPIALAVMGWTKEKKVGKKKVVTAYTNLLIVKKHFNGTYTYHDDLNSDIKKADSMKALVSKMNIPPGSIQSPGNIEIAKEAHLKRVIKAKPKRKLDSKDEEILSSHGFVWDSMYKCYNKLASGPTLSISVFKDGSSLIQKYGDYHSHKMFFSVKELLAKLPETAKAMSAVIMKLPPIPPPVTAPTASASNQQQPYPYAPYANQQVNHNPDNVKKYIPPAESVKVGSAIEEKLNNYGFTWNSAKNAYYDTDGNMLKIALNRSSIIMFSNGNVVNNNNLIGLLHYLGEGGFRAQKKKINPNSSMIDSAVLDVTPTPTPTSNKLTNRSLLEHMHKFLYNKDNSSYSGFSFMISDKFRKIEVQSALCDIFNKYTSSKNKADLMTPTTTYNGVVVSHYLKMVINNFKLFLEYVTKYPEGSFRNIREIIDYIRGFSYWAYSLNANSNKLNKWLANTLPTMIDGKKCLVMVRNNSFIFYIDPANPLFTVTSNAKEAHLPFCVIQYNRKGKLDKRFATEEELMDYLSKNVNKITNDPYFLLGRFNS
jgi:hypothetical protein